MQKMIIIGEGELSLCATRRPIFTSCWVLATSIEGSCWLLCGGKMSYVPLHVAYNITSVFSEQHIRELQYH